MPASMNTMTHLPARLCSSTQRISEDVDKQRLISLGVIRL